MTQASNVGLAPKLIGVMAIFAPVLLLIQLMPFTLALSSLGVAFSVLFLATQRQHKDFVVTAMRSMLWFAILSAVTLGLSVLALSPELLFYFDVDRFVHVVEDSGIAAAFTREAASYYFHEGAFSGDEADALMLVFVGQVGSFVFVVLVLALNVIFGILGLISNLRRLRELTNPAIKTGNLPSVGEQIQQVS